MARTNESVQSRGEKIAYLIEQNRFIYTIVDWSGIIDIYMKRVHKREKLSPKEKKILDSYVQGLKVEKRKTKRAVMIVMVGAIGSGKSTTARAIAERVGATVVEGDEVRVALRKAHQPYDAQRMITEEAALDVVRRGGNVVLDGDFIPLPKRASLIVKAKKAGAKVLFVRTVCDYDVAVGRAVTADTQNEFFEGASSKWTGDKKGYTVKMRELWRRTPHHYQWVNEGGGTWILKNPRFKIAATIDTTDPATAQRQVGMVAQEILKN